MTITKAEVIFELREFLLGASLLDAAKFIRGARHVTPGQWASWKRSVKRASEFLEKLDGPKKPPTHKKVYCERCDGCGWYEGGKTIQTKCEECGGSGVVVVKTQERKETV